MSHFTGAHNILPFDSKTSVALTGQRLCKVTYKTTAKQAAKFPNVCVSLPPVTGEQLMPALDALMPHIVAMVQAAQDGVVRSLYESSEGTRTAVSDSDISISACIGYLDAEATGGRLTKELIDGWFINTVSETLTPLMGEKLGYTNDDWSEEQVATVARHVKGWQELYASLAGGKTVLQPNQIKNLLSVAELVDTTEIGAKLVARLVKMSETPKVADMLELF